jgi:uncharacterized protein with PQ loop repeat
MHELINILTAAAIFLFIVSAIPQIYKLQKTRSARGLSPLMSMLIALGNLLMLARSISIRDWYFSANYAFQLMLWTVILVLIFRYRNMPNGKA